jgi:hypothetical protein
MTLQVDIPDSLARQANERAARLQVSVDPVVAAALVTQLSAALGRGWTCPETSAQKQIEHPQRLAPVADLPRLTRAQ